MQGVFIVLFVFGLIVGSFLNVLIFRYELDKNVFNVKKISGRSKCRSCGKTLSFFELVPVLSFFFQGGKCKGCKQRISWQYPLVEILVGLTTFGVPYVFSEVFFIKQLFLAGEPMFWFVSICAIWILVFYVLITAAAIDFRLRVIPNELNALLTVFGVVAVYWQWYYQKFGVAEGSFLGRYGSMFGFRDSVFTNHILAAVLALAFFILIVILSRGRGMGIGDVKMAVALGILFGWPDTVLIIMLSFIIGAIGGLGLVVFGEKKMKSLIPFGPFLVLSASLVFFFGEGMVRWYFGMFGIV